jgi:hypothetical protein
MAWQQHAGIRDGLEAQTSSRRVDGDRSQVGTEIAYVPRTFRDDPNFTTQEIEP